jgi:hypothetical protein
MWLDRDGLMLDGKTREEACEQIGIEGRYLTYEGDDPIGFVISQNRLRRHMSEVDLAFIGDELARLAHARPSKVAREQLKTQDDVAAELGINKTLISNVRTLRQKAEPG